MAKLIILEGPDCCGKTTLARDLVKTMRATYLHNTYISKFNKVAWDYRTNEIFDIENSTRYYDANSCCPYIFYYHEELLRQAFLNLELNKHVIMDRCWLSELVYSTCLRGVNDVELLPWINRLNDQLRIATINNKRIDFTFVFCISEKGREIHEANRDEAHPYTSEQWNKLYSAYQSLSVSMAARDKCIMYDLDESDNVLDVLKQLTN